MSNDPLSDALARVPEPDSSLDGIRTWPALAPLLEPKLLILCAEPDYTVEHMVADKPDVTRQWAEQLDREGHHVTTDAIEVSYNAAGGFDAAGPEHAAHPHLAMTCFVARIGGKS